jgi:aerobic-type carbon monoxide dehydrogenase small subunit (CoxS/CutS family)
MMVDFILNGRAVSCDAPANILLLDLLRSELGVLSVKRGCEQGECGACTVLLDGRPMNSCMILAARVEGRSVTTIEGLRDEPIMVALYSGTTPAPQPTRPRPLSRATSAGAPGTSSPLRPY